MSNKKASLEIIAPTVEEAVERGLAELSLPAGAVEVEVLDAGSRGLFGLGSRQARVRLKIKSASEPANKSLRSGPKPAMIMLPISEETGTGKQDIEEEEGETPEEEEDGSSLVREPAIEVSEKLTETSEEAALQVARDTVDELLRKMKIRAQVSAHLVEPDDEHSRAAIWVDVRGQDLSILIGPRSETLNALQYLSGLILSKELGRSIPLVIDIEGYRARRIQQLRRLARQMADQAVKTGRRQMLEPMPAEDRRIVHIELRNHPSVMTESVGEDPRRKVTIVPKS